METREYDIMMDMLANPGMDINNLMAAGMTADNTSLQERSKYKENEWVRDLFKDAYGNFDEKKFNDKYNLALSSYNYMANTSYNEAVAKLAIYHRDDIDSPVNQRRKGPDFRESRIPNPLHITTSLFELGKVGDPQWSTDELALKSKVLLNPTTAGKNLENAKWGDSPNDSFWGYFTDTLVQALWDEAGDHTDPITGETVHHEKGDLKLNSDGDFYYEKLDGRDIYNRRVLNKMNVLTTDGSWANQYDFFDSDDLKKSTGGTIMKNAALVGSMFIPYVGPVVTAISIGTQLAGLGATLGKMLVGSDSPTLSAIEGWSKSVSRLGNVSEYALQHPWCWENFINLIGDVAAQLKEQRFIFDYVPKLVKGNPGNLLDLSKQLGKAWEKERLAALEGKYKGLELLAQQLAVKATANVEGWALAKSIIEKSIKELQNLGAVLSKGYMTAITVGDTYGEAKAAGASDLEATMLTIGHAAGEYAILNTGLGEWILPELRNSGARNRAIVNAVTSLDNGGTKTSFRDAFRSLTSKEDKRNLVLKLFNLGKSIATAEYATGAKGLSKATFAAAAGEGFEEVSEEVLADFAKGCFDVVQWLKDDDTRLNSFGYDFKKGEWNADDFTARYGMSLLGGAIGGGLTHLGTNYQQLKSFNNMTSEKALQELIFMARNGEIDGFLKSLDKMDLGNKNLSTTLEMIDGIPTFMPGTKQNNQDLDIKLRIRKQILFILDILSAHGGNVRDEKLLSENTLKELRFHKLYNAKTAGLYLLEFNSLTSELVRDTARLKEIASEGLDSNEDGVVEDWESRRNKLSEDLKKEVSDLEKRIKETSKKILDIREGKNAYNFIRTTLFELSTPISSIFTPTLFPFYALLKTGKKYQEIQEAELEKLNKEYIQWLQAVGVELTRKAADFYNMIATMVSDVLTKLVDTYKRQDETITNVNNFIKSYLNSLEGIQDVDKFSDLALYYGDRLSPMKNGDPGNPAARTVTLDPLMDVLLNALDDKESLKEIQEFEDKNAHIDQMDDAAKLAYSNVRSDLYVNAIVKNINKFMDPYIQQGFMNRETKLSMLNMLNGLKFTISRNIEALASTLDPFNPDPLIEAEQSTLRSMLTPISEALKLVEGFNESPLETNLNQFSYTVKGEPFSLTTLIEQVYKSFKSVLEDVSTFKLSDDLYAGVKNAITLLNVYKAAILGARTDANNMTRLYGYNSTINEIAKKLGVKAEPLAEIDSKTADILLADIDANLSKLTYLKKLQEVNRGYKLAQNDVVAAKLNYLLYNRFRNIINVPDDDDRAKSPAYLKLMSVINNMQTFQQMELSLQFKLSNELKKTMVEEFLKFEDAIYEFFNDPDTPIKLSDILDFDKLNLYSTNEEIINEGTNSVNDLAFLWYLLARASVKASDFYSNYKEVIDPKNENPLAPISPQEHAVYLAFANFMNGDQFNELADTVKAKLKADWAKKSPEERAKVLDSLGWAPEQAKKFSDKKFVDYVSNFIPMPRYSNAVLIEGIAGSGKTKGVFRVLKNMIDKVNPDLLKDAMVVHGVMEDDSNPDSKKNSEELAEGIGIKDAQTFNRILFLKHLASEYKELKKDDKGNYIVPDSAYEFDSDNELRSTIHPKQDSKPPKIIFIDEITNFSSYDMDIINEYARKHGVLVVAAGDFDQSGIYGTHKIKMAGENDIAWLARLHKSNFIRSLKLGMSMRTDNVIKTLNQLKFLQYITNHKNDPLLEFYEDETGLYGDYVALMGEGVNRDDEAFVKSITDYVDKLIPTLKEGLTIGYIYDDDSTKLYLALQADKYKGKITPRKGNSSQGKEGQYYIIDLHEPSNPAAPIDEYLSNVYTGMTRALQGSIIIKQQTGKAIFGSKLVSENVGDYATKQSIASFAAKKKELLDSLLSKVATIEFHQRTPINTGTPASGGAKRMLLLSSGDTVPDHKHNIGVTVKDPGGNVHTIADVGHDTKRNKTYYLFSDGTHALVPEVDDKWELSTIEEWGGVDTDTGNSIPDVSTLSETLMLDSVYDDTVNTAEKIVDTKPKATQSGSKYVFDVITHSFNSFELGRVVKDGKILSDSHSSARIDSLNGLLKINGFKTADLDTLETALGVLRSSLFNISNKTELINKFHSILGIDIKNIRFGLKSSSRVSPELEAKGLKYLSSQPNPFEKSTDERSILNGVLDDKHSRLNLKNLVAVVTVDDNGKERAALELPLFTLSSPLTLMLLKDSGGNYIFLDVINTFKAAPNTNAGVVDVINSFENVPGYEDLINLFKLYHITDNNIWFIDDNTWTPAHNMESLGPMIVKNRGALQLDGELIYDSPINDESSYISLLELKNQKGVVITSKVYVNINPNDMFGGKVETIKTGHPFILYSNNTEYNSDLQLFDLYERQISDPTVKRDVILIYTVPPRATLQEYFDNLGKELSSDPNKLPIGDLYTAFNLLEILMADNDFKEMLKKKHPKLFNGSQNIESIIADLSSLKNSKPKEFREELFKPWNWKELGFPDKKISLKNLLIGVLGKAVYILNSIPALWGYTNIPTHFIDLDGVNLVTKILGEKSITHIYYRTDLEDEQVSSKIKGCRSAKLSDNYESSGLPYRVHGKIDSQAFRADMSKVVSSLLNKTMYECPDGTTKNLKELKPGEFTLVKHFRSYENVYYWDFRSQKQGYFKEKQVSQAALDKLACEKLMNNYKSIFGEEFCKKVLFKKRLALSTLWKNTGRNISLTDEAVIRRANKNGWVAFRSGTTIYAVLNPKGSKIEFENDTVNIDSLKDSHGVAVVKATVTNNAGETSEYNLTINGNNLEWNLIPKPSSHNFDPNDPTVIGLSITPESFGTYMSLGMSKIIPALNTDNDPTGSLEMLFDIDSITTYADFVNFYSLPLNPDDDLSDWYTMYASAYDKDTNTNPRLDFLNGLLLQATDAVEQLLIKDLIQIETIAEEREKSDPACGLQTNTKL